MSTNNAINNVAGATDIKITTYTSNDTWTKDAKCLAVEFYVFNGGSGGGSGRQGATTAAGGGGGATSGTSYYGMVYESFLSATEAVVVGTGGAGGAAQTVASTDGNNGAVGTASSFGNFSALLNSVDSFGMGGTTTGGIRGKWGFTYASGVYLPMIYKIAGTSGTGTDGGNGSNGDGLKSYGENPDGVIAGNTSGGGGGGADSATERAGGYSNGIRVPGGALIIPNAAGGLESGTINGTDGADGSIYTFPGGGFIYAGQGGGGGGGQKSGAAAGNGGKGGLPGGGGGGGGGSLNGTNSGAGGDGGDGLVVIIEYLHA